MCGAALLDDLGEIIHISNLPVANSGNANRVLAIASTWWTSVLETRWIANLGRSRFLCAIVSILFHLSILLLLLTNFTRVGENPSSEIPSVVPIELVTLGDETNMAAMVSRQLPFAPSDRQVDMPAPPAKPEAAPGLEMKLFPAQPAPATQPSTTEADGTGVADDGKPPSSLKDTTLGEHDINKVGQGTAMTMSVADYLRNQIAQCWRYAGMKKPQVVIFELYLDGSGSIERPPRLIEPTELVAEAVTAAESVRQAIYTCAPYRLPADRAQLWRQITLRFDTRMVRGSRR